jgi:hypothetical protein
MIDLVAPSSAPRPLLLATVVCALAVAAGCESTKRFTTTMEVIQVEPFRDENGNVAKFGLELRYADCPGDARRVLHADKAFAACSHTIKAGDKLKTELVSSWQSDKGSYRSDIVRLGECTLKQDPKDDANYEMVQNCTDVIATGSVVGVRCDRTRSKDLVEKCPWLRRK